MYIVLYKWGKMNCIFKTLNHKYHYGRAVDIQSIDECVFSDIEKAEEYALQKYKSFKDVDIRKITFAALFTSIVGEIED